MVGDPQLDHWNAVYRRDPEKFGLTPSVAAESALLLFREYETERILELGCGPGRDALYFAEKGLHVTALDYSITALRSLGNHARSNAVAARIGAMQHDLRAPLPFFESEFDACYSHMALCMELREAELMALVASVRRALKPGGLHVYTVRSIHDPDYRTGTHLGEDLYEVDGYAIHFFDRAKIERLSKGYRLLYVDQFDEEEKRLFFVAMQRE
jgi:SAM-dependent methyltransferase